MTFAAVGGLIQAQATTFTLTPNTVGDFILLEVIQITNRTTTVSGVSSSNVTWSQLGTGYLGVTEAYTASVWIGKVTATSAATVTISWSAATPVIIAGGQEFSTTAGFSALALDVQGHIDTAGTSAWASLTPAAAHELYFGFAANQATAVAGTTSGFTWDVDVDGDGLAYNPNCGASAVQPVWADTAESFGIMVLVKETAAASSTVQPRPTLVPPRRKPARAVWRTGAGPAFVFVPAPPQRPSYPRRKPARAVVVFKPVTTTNQHGPNGTAQRPPMPPRRNPARAVWRTGAGQAFVFVPAPPQRPSYPRRKPARAVVVFKPVTTTTTGPAGTIQPHSTVPVPRRKPARGVWQTGAGPAFVQVAAPRQQPSYPRRKPSRAVIIFRPAATVNAAAGPPPAAGAVVRYGIALTRFTQTFTSNSTVTMPGQLARPPEVWAWGPSGTAAAGVVNTSGGGGGGGGSLGGEPALGGVSPGTVLTVTVPAGGSGTATTVTGGAVTVTGNAGGNAATTTGGSAGAASGNTVAFAGGAGGNSISNLTAFGGGGGGSAGSTGAGGAGAAGSGGTGGGGGTAGTGSAGPPSLAGAAGGQGGSSGANGAAGTVPGSGPGGGAASSSFTAAGAAAGGQVIISWETLVIIPQPPVSRPRARALVTFQPVTTVNTTPGVAGTAQPWPTIQVPRRHPARGQWHTGAGPAFVQVPAPPQRPAGPRRKPARALVIFTPVATVNTAPGTVPGTVQPGPTLTPPRRKPARALVAYRPVRTTNAAVTVTARPALTADYDGKSWWKKRWILGL